MNVTVISMQAIMAGRERVTWTGDVDFGFDGHDGSTNEKLFRFFNRVDEADVRRLDDLSYDLPSLSVGDVIYWKGKAWRVAGSGFRFIDPDDLAMASLFDTIRPEGVRDA